MAFRYSKTKQDSAYLEMLRNIIKYGYKKIDRTGVGTIGIHGYQAKYDMTGMAHYNDGDLVVKNFPLLTTKKMFVRGIIEELLWFLRGATNIKTLVDRDVHIWNDWPLKYYNSMHPANTISMEEFIANIKADTEFAAKWGELGPVYGYQWRNWPNTPSRIDQLSNLIADLKNNPFSRRHIVTAWNPSDIKEMSKSGLPPCHMMFQCMVRPPKDNDPNGYCYLDLEMYQRSTDTFLGAPFNIASYSLLLCLLAKEVGMLPGCFIHASADTHVYLNHLDQVEEQLTRKPRVSPTLTIDAGGSILNDTYAIQNFVLTKYFPDTAIKGEIAV